MARAIVVDTDVLVDFLRGQADAVAFVKARSDRILLSAIVVAELYAGVRGEVEMAVLDALVSSFRVAPVNAELAKGAGLHKRDYGKSHGMNLGDAILAATAQSETADLATLNVKHYPMFHGLRPAYAKR